MGKPEDANQALAKAAEREAAKRQAELDDGAALSAEAAELARKARLAGQ